MVTMYELVKKTKEENERHKLREEWLAQLPFMALKMLKFTDFESYAGQRKEVEEVRREIRGE